VNQRRVHRPIAVTVAVALVALTGAYNVVLGILVLLSRYDVAGEDVLAVSLVGAGIILFGLLTLAVASGIARGSRLSRLLVTVYIAVQLTLHVITIVTSDAWDGLLFVQIALQIALLVVLWTPLGSHYFRSREPAPDPFAP
jgi:hypothetical protein